jgi:hypothetical protein
MVYVDPAVDTAMRSLPPKQERTVMPDRMISGSFTNRGMVYSFPVLERPIVTAGILADGTTTGDADLLARLVLRRSNFLAAVDMALKMLSVAGRHNVPRDQLIGRFKAMEESVNRWYLPSEQCVGRSLYQSIIAKLINLPEVEVGSPFPPATFVAQETARLSQQRFTLLELQASAVDEPFGRR